MLRHYTLFFLSLLLFLSGFAQSITITSPNGAEAFMGCTQQTITWTAIGTSNDFSIDYSPDNGVTWVSVTSFYNTTSGSYAWTVPNISSSQCLIRITDSNSGVISDQSDAIFTINAPLLLTAPNGGESWEAGTSQQIMWAASGTSGRYRLEYSIDAGINWTTITNSYYNSSGIYNWSVPNTPSTSCLVRVSDYYDACMTDQSENLFTITPPTQNITVTNPNTGDVAYTQNNFTISWTSTFLNSPYVKIELSRDGGATWSVINAATNDDGSYSWAVTGPATAQALIRISEENNASVFDVSDMFEIADPYILVTNPNGGETEVGCEAVSIQWTQGGAGSTYYLDYSLDGGATWTYIGNRNSSSTSQSYTWYPPSVNTSNALVRVRSNSTARDSSDAVFTIQENTEIQLNSPLGGEQWEAGLNYTISWVAASGHSRYRVYYSTDNQQTWSLITTTYSTSYSWVIPNTPDPNCFIRVEDYYDDCYQDMNATAFEITPPTPVITVTEPDPGDTWYSENSYNITWTSAFLSSPFVKIEYTDDGGATWNTIANSTNDDGAYSWAVPSVVSSNCTIRVSDVGNAATYGESGAFSIQPPYIAITNPNGGETEVGCEAVSIQWTQGGAGSTYYLDYSLDGGATWTYIGNRNSSSTSQSYTWYPPSVSSSNALVRVRSNSTARDSSDAVFTIQENTEIQLNSPMGGEQWEAGLNYTISWVAASGHSRYRVYYSTDNQQTWNLITTTYSTSYSWVIPNTPAPSCFIRVEDYYDDCYQDMNATAFEITPPTPVITVTEPDPGDTWYSENSYNITWTSAFLSSPFVKIEYTDDGGATWNTIVNSTNDDGSYPWAIPSMTISNCTIRVSDVGNAATYGESGSFSIQPPYIDITNPNGGETEVGCEAVSIQWTQGGAGSTYYLDYSLDGGATWTYIGNRNSSSTSQSYTWYPPSVSSSNALIRINSNTTASDSSDAVFTIQENTEIVLTSPLGGEQWETGLNYTVSWVAASGHSRYRLYYSTDNQQTWSLITTTYSTSYNWTIPNSPSTNCFIRVEDYYDDCYQDINSLAFSIVPPTPVINITEPDPNDTWYEENSYNITWTSAFLTSSFVSIDYSTDSGSTWQTIISTTNDDGSYNWAVPTGINSTNCIIRVSELGNPAVYDESGIFSILPPYITITSPNGGESLIGCEAVSIQWTQGGAGSSYYLDYSLDGGATWSYIGTRNSSSTSQSYTWYPPSINSSNALIRINSTKSASDQSNAVFTIQENTEIILNSPTGGEQWEAGLIYNVNWVAASGHSRYRLYYSIDSMQSWNLITTTYSTSYNWTIPNSPAPYCFVRVEDYYDDCYQDMNAAPFEIIPPTPSITITEPDPADVWYAENNYNITWTSAFLNSPFVQIDYSVDGGNTWTNITNATDDDGSYSWPVPSDYSSNAVIRVSDVGDTSVYAESGLFEIAPPYITVTSPNGGESVVGCLATTISWIQGGSGSIYYLDYSLDGGATWNYIGQRNSSSTNQSYTWYPPSINSSNALIRINSTKSATDESDGVFTIQENTEIVLNSPIGGEQWEAGLTYNINWVATSGHNRYRVYYSTDNQQNWNLITTTYSTSYNWTIPNIPSSNCFIRVEDYYDDCYQDINSAPFTITPPTPVITVTSPNSNLTLFGLQNYNISWNSAFLSSSFVRIEFSADSGMTWQDVVAATTDDGSYSWSVPQMRATECLIRVSDAGNSSTYDLSNVFQIKPAVTILSPNGDNGIESWRGCTETTITWEAGNNGNSYRLEYSLDNGQNWSIITSSYNSSGTMHSYNWTIPNSPSDKCLVRVSNAGSSTKVDQSDATFTISAPVRVLQPNFGSVLYAGTTHDISWLANGTTNSFNIEFSSDGGSSWSSIVFNQNLPNHTYSWTVPSIPSANCMIRVSDNVDNCKSDMSDMPFEIRLGSPAITLTSPNGGESFLGCVPESITWTASGTSGSYKLSYSTNGGQSWQTIVNNHSGTSYNWTVANATSSTALIRVEDANDANKSDQSDAAFSLTPSITAEITASGSTDLCAGESVTLQSNSGIGNLWSPAGQTTPSIIVNSSGQYYLTVTINNCSATSDTIQVNVQPAVFADAGMDTILNVGESIVLGGANAGSGGTGILSYHWTPADDLSDPSAPNPTATPSESETYTLTVSDANGCSDTDEVMLSIGCGKDIFEDNDSWMMAAALPDVGVNKNATICNAGDIDWFVYTTQEATHLNFELSNLPADLDLEVYNDALQMLGSSTRKNTQDDNVVVNNVAANTSFYIKVAGGSADVWSTEGYGLRVISRSLPFGILQKDEEAGRDETIEEVVASRPERSLQVYPNPTKDVLYIQMAEGKASMSLYNLQGEIVLRKAFEQSTQVEVGELARGAYFWRVEGDTWQENGKLLLIE